MEKNDTKNKIMTAAFKTLLEVPFSRMSLSDVARNAGITKPAIYRHFASKQDLMNQLNVRFYDDLALFFKEFDIALPAFDIFAYSIDFFMRHPGYLNFFLLAMLYSDRFDEVIKRELHKRGFDTDIFNAVDYEAHLEGCSSEFGCLQYTYVIATGMFNTLFIHLYERQSVDFPVKFADHVAHLVFDGWKCIRPLPVKRLEELEKIAAIDPMLLPNIGRFGAVACVIKKYGFPETTIERIAAEIGVAKSSLYYHFKNKTDFFTNFLLTEMHFLNDALQHRMRYAHTLSEALYVFLCTAIDYAVQREEILPVFGWMRHSGHLMDDVIKTFDDPFCVFSEYAEYVSPDFGFGEVPNTFIITWIHSVAISTVVQFCVHGYGAQAARKQVRQLFSFITDGVMTKKTANE